MARGVLPVEYRERGTEPNRISAVVPPAETWRHSHGSEPPTTSTPFIRPFEICRASVTSLDGSRGRPYSYCCFASGYSGRVCRLRVMVWGFDGRRFRHDADCEQECVDMSELSNEAIRAIAEHEHIPEVVAAELGQELLKVTGGMAELERILEENLGLAVQAGEQDKINDRKRVLGRFVASYRK